MAVENERLKDLLTANGIDPFSGIGGKEKNIITTSKVYNGDVMIEDGDGNYPKTINLKIDNASGSMNSLSVSYGSFDGQAINAIICGGVDKVLRVYNLQGELSRQYEFSAPILALDSYQSFVSCSMMDGSHAVVDLSQTNTEPQIYRTHNKYVVGTAWSTCGNYLFTCSHDKSVGIFNVIR